MNSPTKMHYFLQRMLKKDEELEVERKNVVADKTKVDNSSPNKTNNWIKNLAGCSPSKLETTITRSPSRPITLITQTEENRKDFQRKSMPIPSPQKKKSYSEETPTIDQIRREFEMGFLSPTQRDSNGISSRSGLFVKKIVAAFEEKYKPRSDDKAGVKGISKKHDSSEENSFEEEIKMEVTMNESITSLSETCVIESLENRLTRYLDSYIASSPIREDVESGSETSFDSGNRSFTIADQECSPILKSPIYGTPCDEANSSSGESTPRSSARSSSVKIVRRESSIKRERQPTIVGAYLKKPIKVEDTSIDWIPITGKKLPRKKSFKRLLSILTGKKSADKSSKLYCSEVNLQEETTRELLQDSGYDEKSASSSSLTSLVSINDLLLQQKCQNPRIQDEERRVMKTFGPGPQLNSVPINTDHDFRNDDSSSMNDEDTWSVNSKRLFLEEVSRSELRLSLGPSFPSRKPNPNKLVCSLNRRETKIGKSSNDFSSDFQIAAPFSSSNVSASPNRIDDTSMFEKSAIGIHFSEFDQVQLRRDFQSWKFPTEEFQYDTPKRFLSKSEPALTVSYKRRNPIDKLPIEIVYDVPKPNLPGRPRSSIYDEALSLKRRNDRFQLVTDLPTSFNEFYGFSSNQEPQYATIKPRNGKRNANRQFLRSVGDLNSNDTKYTDNYHGRFDLPIAI